MKMLSKLFALTLLLGAFLVPSLTFASSSYCAVGFGDNNYNGTYNFDHNSGGSPIGDVYSNGSRLLYIDEADSYSLMAQTEQLPPYEDYFKLTLSPIGTWDGGGSGVPPVGSVSDCSAPPTPSPSGGGAFGTSTAVNILGVAVSNFAVLALAIAASLVGIFNTLLALGWAIRKFRRYVSGRKF